ncbi:MAG: beta strand repeat-containing protein [Planctomycetota bacterium]
MAVDVFQYPVSGVTSGNSNYAVLLVDDGGTGYLKKNATPSPTFTFATNSQFLDDPATTAQEAYTFGELLANAGVLETMYVTSGRRETYIGPSLDASFVDKTTSIINYDPVTDQPIFTLGTSDGIVPGTFLARLSVVDSGDKVASAWLLASKPGDRWNLSIESISGDGALPTEGDVDEFTGNVTLRGWGEAPKSVSMRPLSWGVYTGLPDDTRPLSFTLSPGQTVTQRFLVDLSRTESTISLNSPVLAERGNTGDPRFFAGAGGVAGQVAQVVLDASTVVTNANVSSTSLFTIGVPVWVNGTRVPVDVISINRPVAAPRHQLILESTADNPGQFIVSEQGALANSLTTPDTVAAGSLDIQAKHADVILAGTVNAVAQTYLLQSPLDPRAYTLSTVASTSGVQTGRILGTTVGITLANDAGGEVNVRTAIDTLRMTAAETPAQPALPYAITVSEADSLTVDAVPASRRPIAISAAGTLTLASSVQTIGDVAFSALNKLGISGAISSAAGSIGLVSDSIVSTAPINAGGTRNVSIQSREAAGDIDLNGLVRAGGPTKAPVRAATAGNVDLATGGLLTVDGVALAAGDRVLVKNQDDPSANGIYVVSAGAWSRAADAAGSQAFAPGFMVAVHEGAQQGAWTFANAVIPLLGQTGLAFVPASAVQAYVPARVATTANVNLASGGLLTVDGVSLAVGDRVLVMNQTNPRQNGLYVVATGGWTRAADADTAAELVAGSYVFVAEGATGGRRGFVLTDDVVQVGNTPLSFVPFVVEANRTNTYSPARVLASVVAATTVHIDLAAPPPQLDGVDLVTGDLILVKNQFDSVANGIYVYAAGGLQRWAGADSSSELPRGSLVFVEQGATNTGSSWTFDDSVDLLGQTVAGKLTVTGLASTLLLSPGMTVNGPGIPADTRIDVVVDAASVRLTRSALVSSSVAALRFMQTSAVAVGTTPILFVPSGGGATITAGRSITSAATTARTALLTAGRPTGGTTDTSALIDVRSTVGRASATAPGSVKLVDQGTIALVDVRSLSGGGVDVTAQGTISSRLVTAAGTASDVSLASEYGDVVAATVTSTTGSIRLASVNGRVIARRLGLNASSIVAEGGDVTAEADVGGIRVEGTVRASGTDGDVTFQSNQGGLTVVSPATIQARDRLTVVTPNAIPALAAGTTVTAAALAITSQFGASQSPPAGFGTYSTVNFNRTDAGKIVFSSPVALTIEAATTVQGDISLTAPSISVTGGITAGAAPAGDGSVTLVASAGGIALGGAVTAQSDRVTLNAKAGSITQSGGTVDSRTLVWHSTTSPFPGLTGSFTRVGSNLTGPGNLSLGTATAPIIVVGASTVNGTISITGSSVRIVDTVKTNAGNAVSVTATTGGIDFVSGTLGAIVTAPAGAVTLSAPSGKVTAENKATRTTVRGGALALQAQAADLKCNVASLASTTTLGGLTVSAVGGLTLAGVAAAGQTVSLDAAGGVSQATGGIVATSLAVTNLSGPVTLSSASNAVSSVAISNGSGNVSLTGTGTFEVAGTGVSTGGPSAGDGDVSLRSIGGDIVLNAGVAAGGDRVTLDASSGSITQKAGVVASRALIWYASTPASLTGTFNEVGANLTAPGNLSLAVQASQRVLATSTKNGSITITGPAVTIGEPVAAGGAGSVAVSATAGSITLQPAAGSTASINAPAGLVSLSASGQVAAGSGTVSGSSVSIASGDTVVVGTMTAATTMAITTTAGGGVDVGPTGASLLQAGSTLDLRNVQGSIVIRNGGRIIGNPLLLAPGKTIGFGGPITTATDLVNVVNAVNLLPAIPGSTYEILVSASMTLPQTLNVYRPVTFRGTSTNVVLSGSPSVTSGLVLNPGAGGSIVRNIAFSSFSGSAVTATSLSGVTISGVKVMNSGTGIRLSSVTSSTIGGSTAGQGNVLQNCGVGIYATGICSSTQLVKNTFTGTRTKYSVASSRGITVVN